MGWKLTVGTTNKQTKDKQKPNYHSWSIPLEAMLLNKENGVQDVHKEKKKINTIQIKLLDN